MPCILAAICRVAIALVCFSVAGVHVDCADAVGLTTDERDFYLRADTALKLFFRPAPVGEDIRNGDSESSLDGTQV